MNGSSVSAMVVLSALGVAAMAGTAAAQTAELIILPRTPGNQVAVISAVSGDGQVVVGSAGGGQGIPFRWNRDTGYHMFPTGAGYTRARIVDCSEDGSVVVGHGQHDVHGPVAFAWLADDTVVPLIGEAGRIRSCYGVSGDGQTVVGENMEATRTASYWKFGQGLVVLPTAPFGSLTTVLSDVNEDGTIFAGSALGNDGQAFLWDSTNGYTMMGTLGGEIDFAYVAGLNASGEIVIGRSSSSQGGSPGFMWTAAYGMYPLPLVSGSTNCELTAISADGRVVVGASRVSTRSQGVYFYTEGMGAMYLESYLNSEYGFTLAPASLYNAVGISNDGRTIVGGGSSAGQWVVKLPQPQLSDFNLDRMVDFHDLNAFLDCFEGRSILPISSADLNRDGMTDFFDLLEFMDNF